MAFNFNWKPQDLSYQQYQFLSNPDEAFKNRTNTKQAQEMLGFEGNGIDGVAGKATRDAYNKQMRYYNDLYGNVSKAGSLDLNDPNAFYNDIHDAETYDFTPQEAENELNADILAEKQQQEAKEQQIANIESKIATLEKRIADNTAKLKNWNGGDVANKVAALEARKFFSQDPTSIWRWKQDKDYATQLAAKQNGTDNTAKANAMIEIANDLDSIIVDDTMTSQDKKAYLSKLSNMKTLGEKAGVPKSVIDSINAKIKEVKGETEQHIQEKPESVTDEDFEYEGGPRDVGEARATKILQKDPEKLTQQELTTLKRDIKTGKISVSNETKNKIDKLNSQVIERDKKRVEADKKEERLLKKGKNLSSDDLEFLKGRKGLKHHTDSYGNEWYTRG